MDAKVFSIQEVSLGFTPSVPPSVIIGAAGTAPTSGWSNGRLIPRVYVIPPEDGLWDFDFIATTPSGIALQKLTPISSTPFVAKVPEWFKGARVHASTNSASQTTETAGSESVSLTQFSSSSLDGGDYFSGTKKADGGVDGFPWYVVLGARKTDEDLPTNETILQKTVGSTLGMLVRVHRETDPVTDDYRTNRINFVVAKDKPTILRVYIG